MALKFGDTAKPMGAFPVAEAVDIELTKKDDSKKSLQAMYDDGELGGGEGLPLPEQANMVMMTYENEEGDLDWKQSLLKTVEKVEEIPTTFEDKIYVKNGDSEAQVYASEIELATKEYADTHGAGASVYTKAEWDMLPAKPPAGTQVIISDDIPEFIDTVLTAEFEDGTIKRYKLTGKEV